MKTSSFGSNGLRIDSFERTETYSVGDGTVEMTFNRHNGLDGKISRVEVSIFKKDGQEETIRIL